MPTILGNIATISRCVYEFRYKRLGEELAGVYHRYIMLITGTPGLSQDSIAKRLCINKSSATRHLAILEKDGFITRKPNLDDKREMLVFPTEKAEALRPGILAVTHECNELLAQGIEENELRIFHSVLDRIASRARQIMYPEEDVK